MGRSLEIVAHYGYSIVAIAIGLESMGIPLPGETLLVAAAVYAGTTHQLNIVLVIISAVIGAIVGDNLGFLVGHRFGFPLLLRYGHLLKIDAARVKLGVFLFRRHGGKVVFLGRFVAVLRALAALLAGVNRMPWRRFLFFNATGAIVWAGSYGAAAYAFGDQVRRFSRPLAIGVGIIAALATVWFIAFVRRHEAALQAEAEQALPGALHLAGKDTRR